MPAGRLDFGHERRATLSGAGLAFAPMTRITLAQGPLAQLNVDALIVGVATKNGAVVLAPGSDDVDKAMKKRLTSALSELGATGRADEVTRVPTLGATKAPLVVAVGLGPAPRSREPVLHRGDPASSRRSRTVPGRNPAGGDRAGAGQRRRRQRRAARRSRRRGARRLRVHRVPHPGVQPGPQAGGNERGAGRSRRQATKDAQDVVDRGRRSSARP